MTLTHSTFRNICVMVTLTIIQTLSANHNEPPQDAISPDDETPVTLNMDNGVLPIADNRGFTLQSKD